MAERSALALVLALLCGCAHAPPSRVQDVFCDVVVAEASLGGVAAALQSARLGAKTCLTSMTDWVGGQATIQGVSAIDEPWHLSDADRDETVRSMRPWLDRLERKAECWVSRTCFRPSEGDRRLKDLLRPFIDAGTLRVFYETVPKRVVMAGDLVVAADFVSRRYSGRGERPYAVPLSREILDWYDASGSRRYAKSALRLSGKVFIDATETGELIVLSGARHRLGSSDDPKQPADPECVIGFVFPLNLRSGKPGARERALLASAVDPPGLEPFGFSTGGHRYKFWKDDPRSEELAVWDYRQISVNPPVTMMNWQPGNDYSGESFIIPKEKLGDQSGDWRGGVRVDALEKAEARALAFARWLDEQPEVRWNGRAVEPVLELDASDNFFGTGTGLSKFPYVRETRRMEGYGGFYVTADDVTTSTATDFYDSVGIGSYALDLRACPTGRKLLVPRSLANRYQIPLRALVSSNVANLLSANKTLAVTQLANAAFRLHPTEWNAGLGAGAAAAIAARHGVDAHRLMGDLSLIREVQSSVVASGGRVVWHSDALPVVPGSKEE